MSDFIEYRVVPITRYQVTRYQQGDYREASVEQRGMYDNADVAYEVGSALAKAERDRLGIPPGDDRIRYPERPGGVELEPTATAGVA